MTLKKLKEVARILGYKPYRYSSWREFDEQDLLNIIIDIVKTELKRY